MRKGIGCVLFRSVVLGTTLAAVFGCATPHSQPPSTSSAAVQAEAFKQSTSSTAVQAQASQPPSTSITAVQAEAFKQKCLLLQEIDALESRLNNVFFRVIDGAKQMAPMQNDYYGFHVARRSYYHDLYQAAANEVFQLGSDAKITFVASGSPADLAGLKVGDKVITMDGESVPEGSSTSIVENRKNFAEFQQRLSQDHAIIFRLGRDGEEVVTEVKPISCAKSRILLVNADEVNAFADGERIYVTKGMMRLVSDDNELAMVVSHELAHNIREHPKMSRKNVTAGGVAGLILDIAAAAAGVNTNAAFSKIGMQAGQTAYSKDMEREADYVGLYILANSGYDVNIGPNVFRRMGAAKPKSIEAKYATSHPSTPERFVMLEQTITEIGEKRNANLPLLPTERQKSQQNSSSIQMDETPSQSH